MSLKVIFLSFAVAILVNDGHATVIIPNPNSYIYTSNPNVGSVSQGGGSATAGGSASTGNSSCNPLQLALEFMNGFRDQEFSRSRQVLDDNFVHKSPFDHTVGADAFMKLYQAQVGNVPWTYNLKSTLVNGNTVVLEYDSIFNSGKPTPNLELFKIKNCKILSADDYFLALPHQ